MGKATNKDLSRRHEEFVAAIYEGRRSPSSGASVVDKGDVKDDSTLFECKVTHAQRKPRLVREMEKIAYEAYEQGLDPALSYRFYLPESPLAGTDGYIDLTVRLAGDDAYRSRTIRNGSKA